MPGDATACRVTAVVCTYERYDLLSLALGSLDAQDIDRAAFEILVVDNSPDADRSRAEARRHAGIANLRWLHEATPGLSHARNVAAAAAAAPLLAFMDDDAVAAPGWCAALAEGFAALGPALGALGGRVLPRFLGERPAWLADRMLDHLSMLDLGGDRRVLAPGEWVVGANLAFRREALAAAGGFSTRLGRIGAASLMSGEETEVMARLRAAGWTVGYEPAAVVEHLVEPARLSQAWFARRHAWQAVSAILAGEAGGPAEAERALAEVRRFFAALPPADRTVAALFREEDDPARLGWQLGTLYNLLVCALGGARVPPPRPGDAP